MTKRVRLIRKKKPEPFLFLMNWLSYFWFRLHADFWPTVSPFMRSSDSTGCTYLELFKLHSYVLRNKPSAILELGSGVSTAVIAHAVSLLSKKGHACRFVSMEEGAQWHSQLQQIFPESLRRHAELRLSETEERPLPNGLIGLAYKDKPALAYDFVFIDGPQVPKGGNFFDCDILDVLDWNKGAIVAFLDQRISTREALLRLMPWARVQGNPDFAVFRIPSAEERTGT